MRNSRRLVATAVLSATALLLVGCFPSGTPAKVARSCTVGIVGDSLTVGSMPYWDAAFNSRGCVVKFVNARGGRSTADGVNHIENIANLGWMPDVLVVALGTNDSIHPGDFGGRAQRVMTLAKGIPVVWVNLDKPFVETTLNFSLNTVAMRHSNLWVYNWNQFADSHPQIRLGDQIHLTQGGYNLRAHMIANFVTGT